MPRPEPHEYGPFPAGYIALVPEADVLSAMAAQLADEVAFWRTIPEPQGDVCHPPYTWTVKQVIGHLADGERVFSYRALRIARGDATPLPGYDEGPYAVTAEVGRLALADLIDEFEAVRRASLCLFRNLPEVAWARIGTANDSPMSVRALAYAIVGHVRHHGAILRKRVGAG